ncbi:unnamed protein product, partial [marine sediment metagenome]
AIFHNVPGHHSWQPDDVYIKLEGWFYQRAGVMNAE